MAVEQKSAISMPTPGDVAIRRLKALRWALGYIEAGGGDYVTIGQDDATKDFSMRVGNRRDYYHGSSLEGLLDEVAKAMDADPERV